MLLRQLCEEFNSKCDNCEQSKTAVVNMIGGGCSRRSTCHDGKCWGHCGTYTVVATPWCYTTKMETENGQVVTCKDDSECNTCWNCAGDCK